MNVGVFSGSFNPIHMGHLILANYLYESTSLDKIIFLVSPQNPLKKKGMLDKETRYKMVCLALEDYPMFEASDFEFSLQEPSYTYFTLRLLQRKYPDTDFNLIIGADNWANFNLWKNYQEILDNYKIIIYPRSNSLVEIPEQYQNIQKINSPIIDISSTFIREGIKEGLFLKAFLPHKVFEYIENKNIYRQ